MAPNNHRRGRQSHVALKASLILWDHNTLSIQYGGRGSAHRLFLKSSLRFLYPLADARVAVSKGVADDLAVLAGLPRDKFEVIYNPIYLAPVADRDDEREAENLWRGWHGPRIITVGRFKPQKNHALLLEAFKKLLTVRDARLLILGTGDLLREHRRAGAFPRCRGESAAAGRSRKSRSLLRIGRPLRAVFGF